VKRILFVDDEPQVLDGLRALLRPQRSRWDMTFVDNGEQAVAELDRAPFDVIVADMRMPGMDGAGLLRHVQDRHPGVVRIVLSGYAEQEMAMRAVPVAHQFLAKPCDAGRLETVVERACSLQALIHDDAVRGIVGRIRSLPALPRIHFELTQVLADDECGTADVARVVERDPTMVAKVLQLVNSAFIGLGHQVTSIEQAIAYLGTRLLKDLTLVAHVFGTSASSPASDILDSIQRHSLLVGSIARRLPEADQRIGDDAFIAGILHDIGKLVLASERPDQCARLRARARDARRPLFEIEQEELGTSHAEVGGYLLGIWGLPYPVIEAAANHHAPGRVPSQPGLDVFAAVHIANALAHEASAGAGGESEPFAELTADFLQARGGQDQLPEWRAMAASVVEEARRPESSRRAA
jgi:HD-like signal output (HDOD) protein